MPERPKRRKNKNKRKNKNSNADVNKNNIEESETLNESSSGIAENTTTENRLKKNVEDEKLDLYLVVPSSELDLDKEITKEIVATSEICPILHDTSETDAEIQTKEVVNNESTSPEVCSHFKQSLSNNTINEQTEDVSQTYIVEPPEKVAPSKTKYTLDNTKKSKSCDSDDCPTIVEITDDYNVQSDDSSLPVVHNSNILITGDESDIEWEKVHHFNLPQTQLIQGILSSDTIPLNIVHCDEIKSLSPQEEQSLRNYLHTLNLSTNPLNSNDGDIKTEIEQIINREIKYRLRKKGSTEDTTFVRAGPSRSLAVIDEEGSGDSSKTSRRHSYLSDKKSDNEELEDEVFECKPTRTRCSNINLNANNSNKRLISQPCIRVDAKLKEPEISEARGDWSVKTVEKMTGAELVYLTDSSSSTSSMYDLNDDVDKGEETDGSVRIITPIIEVTDTESLLSNTFLNESSDKNISQCCENKNVLKLTDNLTKNVKDIETNSDEHHDAHEIVILSTDDIKTNLFVRDIKEYKSATESEEICERKLENNSKESALSPSTLLKGTDTYDLEIKVLKCELNNAINNLIKEVISDSENCKETSKDTITRQDSSSSLDSSQCTVKYNATHSSLNDVSNILQEDSYDTTNKENFQIDTGSSHVKDVLQCLTAQPTIISHKAEDGYAKQPSKLKDICVRKITSFPFGDKILEELAQVSLRLQNMSALASERNQAVKNQPVNTGSQINTGQHELRKSSENKIMHHTNIPPPILPRKSSLKIAQDEAVIFTPPKSEAKYECLSPSQKMLMEKTNTMIENDFKCQPHLNTSKTSIGNEKESKCPVIKTSFTPMKSETGSRLLALLRDTSIPNNINRQSLEYRDLNHIPKLKHHSESFSKRLLDELDSTNQYKETTSTKKSSSTIISSSSYKPLPPPKTKKFTTYFYESDEGSDYRRNSFRTMHTNKKYFHHSTGNLNKEIEDDISSIQNMHRYCTNLRNQSYEPSPRRPSLPKDLCDQQMEYIRQKEKEVDEELRRLEQEQNKFRNRGPRAPMISEDKDNYNQTVNSNSKSFVKKDLTSTSQTHKNTGNSKLSSLFSSSQEELLREKMYSEYVNQMAEREQRKKQRVIKVSQTPVNTSILSKSMPLLDNFDSKMNNRIEQEFISKAKERWYKLGIEDPDTKGKMDVDSDLYREPKVIEHKIKVIEAGEEKDVQNLPSHMQEFVKFTVKDKEQDTGSTGESNADETSAHVVVFCAVIILVLTVGKFLLQLLRNK